MPRMVRPLAIVARISAPTRTRGRLPRPPVRATPASATAVSALKMIAGLAAGFASVTTAVVTRPPSGGEQPGDHEAEHLCSGRCGCRTRRTASALPPTAISRMPSRVRVRKTVPTTNTAPTMKTGAGMPGKSRTDRRGSGGCP